MAALQDTEAIQRYEEEVKEATNKGEWFTKKMCILKVLWYFLQVSLEFHILRSTAETGLEWDKWYLEHSQLTLLLLFLTAFVFFQKFDNNFF